MTVDIQESLISAIYTRLTTDATLITSMGGAVRLYHVWAVDDAVFPYLVHRIDMPNSGDFNLEPRCTYYLDIWTDSDSGESAGDIKQQIMALLDNYTSSSAETTNYRIWWQADSFIPETTTGIWHLALQFNVKYLRDAQIGATLYR